jgi:hypothetical protein
LVEPLIACFCRGIAELRGRRGAWAEMDPFVDDPAAAAALCAFISR